MTSSLESESISSMISRINAIRIDLGISWLEICNQIGCRPMALNRRYPEPSLDDMRKIVAWLEMRAKELAPECQESR